MKKLTFLVLFALPFTLMAEEYKVITLTPTTGSESTYALNSVAKHTYVDGKLVTTFTDATAQVETTLNTLSKVSFGTKTSVSTQLDQTNATATNYTLYPIPVAETLNISFSATATSKVQLSILSLDGRTLLTDTQTIHSGTNQLELSTAELQSGIYICHLTNGKETLTQQIIKK